MNNGSNFSPALLSMMEAFEADAAERPDWGPAAWFAHLNTMPANQRLDMPTGLFTSDIRDRLANANAAEWLKAASRPESYADADPNRRKALALLHGATARAVGDLLSTMSRNVLFEVAHNAGFFSHLASMLWTYRSLDLARGAPRGEPMMFWADLASERTEKTVGGDFAIIVPLNRTTCKLAIVQAKREFQEKPLKAKLEHEVGSSKRQQFEILTTYEQSQPTNGELTRRTIFGSWCFYAFWHKPRGADGVLPPIVRSAWDILEEGRELRRRKKDLDKEWIPSQTYTTHNGVDLTTFLALYLPDPDSGVGLKCHPADVPKLIGLDLVCPRSVMLLNLPGCDWPLAYWPRLLRDLEGYVDQTLSHQTLADFESGADLLPETDDLFPQR